MQAGWGKAYESMSQGKSMATTIEHVEERNGEYYVAHTRVPIGVVIAAWERGDKPERIAEQFPGLSLADVYGVIAYFLDHEVDLRVHFARLRDEYERARQAARAERPEFYSDLQRRIDAVRQAPAADDDESEASHQ
jgi:uncharacterized protein (DUF433 family)